ncbi:hypothetical protein ACHWQZ_G006930 [Mnemiopsis leidyi]
MLQRPNHQQCLSLYEFLVKQKFRDHRLLGHPMCDHIMLLKKSSETLSHTSIKNGFRLRWQFFLKTEIYHIIINVLPVTIHGLLADYEIFFQTSRSLRIVLTDIAYEIPKCGSFEALQITRLNLISGQSITHSTNIGGKLQKLRRLDKLKQHKYLIRLLHCNKDCILSQEDTKLLSLLLSDVAKMLTKSAKFKSMSSERLNSGYRKDLTRLESIGKLSKLDSPEVCKFVSSIIISCLPLKLFGTCKFRRIFVRELLKLIRNSEKFQSKFLMQLPFDEMKFSSLKVFMNRPKVISSIFYLIITELIFPMLKEEFVIVKVNKRIEFYSKLSWKELQELGFREWAPYFSEVEEEYVDYLQLSKQLFGVYTIRIQPKTSGHGFRLISMLNKTASCTINLGMSVNAKLVPTAAILKNICSNLNHPTPIKGKFDLQRKIENFKSELVQKGELPKLYFFQCDAKSCYDNIPLKELLIAVLNWLPWSPFYHLVKVQKLCHKTGKINIKTVALPSRTNDALSFEDIVKGLDRSFKMCTITIIKYKVYSMEFTKSNIKLFLEYTVIYHNGKFYRRNKGIPQGSKISKFLCDIYFNYIFRDVEVSVKSLLLSATDDFLFLSPLKTEVDKFMYDCLNGKYKFLLNELKTKSYLNGMSEILYYGNKINVNDC